MRILVADDDPQTRELIAEFLREQGHVVDVAADGMGALDRLRSGTYEVAFLDYLMPGMSGMEVVRAARDDAPGTACIMVTGLADVQTAVEAMRSGASNFVAKPIEPDAIDRVLESVKHEARTHGRRPVRRGASQGREVHASSVRAAFLTNRAGLLLASRILPDESMVDQDLFGATLDVIQNFMRISFPALQGRWLKSIRSGDRILVLEPGDRVLLTVLVRGEETEDLHRRMRDALREFEARNEGRFDNAVVDPESFVGTDDIMARLLGPSPRDEGPQPPAQSPRDSEPKPERR